MSVVAAVPIARLNFPPYVALVLSQNYVLVAGGGGSSKTGVANRLEVYEVNRISGQAVRVSSFDTGSTALMNGTVFHFQDSTYFAGGGIGGVCQVFRMEPSVDWDCRTNGRPPSPEQQGENVMYLRRRNSSSAGTHSNGHVEAAARSVSGEADTITLNYNVQPVRSFKCDFQETKPGKEDESFLKSLKFCPKSEVLVTGGSDGHVRVWKFPQIAVVTDIPAHSDEIVDLDVDFIDDCLVTIARDGRSAIWKLMTGAKVQDLKYEIPVHKPAVQTMKYKFKGCRFMSAPEFPQILFTTLVPAAWSKQPEPCFLCRWSPGLWRIDRRIAVGTDPLAHMCVSPDGGCLAVGTLTGAVSVYGSRSMRKLYHIEKCHRSFITRVEFLSPSADPEINLKNSEQHLISISVDNQICMHTVALSDPAGMLTSSVLFLFCLTIVYFVGLLIGP